MKDETIKEGAMEFIEQLAEGIAECANLIHSTSTHPPYPMFRAEQFVSTIREHLADRAASEPNSEPTPLNDRPWSLQDIRHAVWKLIDASNRVRPYRGQESINRPDLLVADASSAPKSDVPAQCLTPGCGHKRDQHAYGDCLVRSCDAGPHYYNQRLTASQSEPSAQEEEPDFIGTCYACKHPIERVIFGDAAECEPVHRGCIDRLRASSQKSEGGEIERLTTFGAEVLRNILDDGFFFESEESERWCEQLLSLGYVERAVYDPDKHGEIDVDPGDEVWIFTDAMKRAARLPSTIRTRTGEMIIEP